MSEFKPSPQQQRAIDTDGKALLVSAAAGSGKTTVLIQRVMRLLCDGEQGYTADRLMVVTFTVAAAAKLKSDLAHELAERIQRQEGDINRLKKQRMLLSRAAIGTFDSFCKNLCSEFFAKLGIEPDFKVGERLLLDVIETQAMEETLNIMLQDPDFEEFARGFADPRSLSEPQKAIKMLHKSMTSQPHPIEYLNQLLGGVIPDEFAKTSAGKMIFNFAQDSLQNAAEFLMKATELAREHGASAKATATLEEELALVRELTRLAGAGNYEAFRSLMSNRGGAKGFATLNQGKEIDIETRELIKALRKKAKDITCEIYEDYFLWDSGDHAEMFKRHYRLVAALCRATRYYHETLQKIKLKEACFDFYDLQHMTVSLLEQPELGVVGRFFAVMVDEYQDTNPIADYIYHTLVGNDHGALFMVGDVKQSIYGFNSARPDIFADRVKSCESSKSSEVVYLADNYRSSKEVIYSVNDLFGLLMSKPIGGVDYDENNRLYPGRSDGADGVVTLNAVMGEGDITAVANLCRELIDGGRSPEEICVLVSTNKAVAVYSKELERLGMPGGTSKDIRPIDEVGAMPLIALLRLLANPFSEVELIAVMLSPLGGFSIDDITRYAQESETRLILALQKSEDARIIEFLDRFWALRRISSGVSVRQLLQEIYERLDAYVICCAMSNGAEKAINYIEELAQQYDNVGQNGLSGFVKRMDLALERTESAKKEATVQKGFINVMTIHTSKGLEFPICIIADIAHKFNVRDLSSAVLMHEKTSIGIKLEENNGFVDTPFRKASSVAARLDMLSERMRLLYVATTRAKEQLHMFVATKEKKLYEYACSLYGAGGVSPMMLYECDSFADYLLYFALCHPEARALREVAGDVSIPMIKNTGHLAVKVLSEVEEPEVKQQTQRQCEENEELLRLFRYVYPYQNETTEPIKSSVTQLIDHAEFPPALQQPMFARQDMGGAKRGSATHEFLQLCDFQIASKDAGKEMERLLQQGYIDSESARLISLSSIKAFFETSLAKRILASQEVYREYEFITRQDTVVLQGIADLLFIEDDEVVLVDYKTTRANEQKLAKLYREQLRLYAEAIGRRFGRKVKQTIIYSLYLNKEVEINIEKLD